MNNAIINEDINQIITSSQIDWSSIKGKTVLVTGCTGLLATYLMLSMLELNKKENANIRIVGLCRNERIAMERFIHYKDDTNLSFVIQDVAESIKYNKAVDFIIHTASPANPAMFVSNPESVLSANITGYRNVLELAKRWNSKVVLFSTGAVYGTSSFIKANEEYRGIIDFSLTRNCYALSKQVCEHLSEINREVLDITVVRPFVIYGPGMQYKHKKWITDFCNNYIKNESITIKGDGKAIRDLMYISDAIEAIFHVMLLSHQKNIVSTYNICSSETYSIYEMAKKFSVLFGSDLGVISKESNEKYLKDVSFEMSGDNSKLKETGWNPKVSNQEGIQRLVSWAIDNKEFFYEE